MSENQYRQEFLCDFTASADNVLIPIDLVSDAMARHYPKRMYQGAVKILGVDVAYTGDDKSVIIARQGLVCHEPIVMAKLDPMDVAGRLISVANQYKPDAIFVDDTGGYGAGVIARLRELGHKPIGVNFGQRPDDPRFRNKRTEMWVRTRDWLKDGGALPPLLDLKNDLVSPTYRIPSTGIMELEAKDKIKERLGRSPDVADALALTFAFAVNPIRNSVHGGNHHAVAVDYNPLG